MVYNVGHSKAVVLLYSSLFYVCRIVITSFGRDSSFSFLYSSSVYTSQFVNYSCDLGSFSNSGIARIFYQYCI